MDVSKPLSALAQQRELMLNEASHWSVDALVHRPKKRTWSALELIDHLARLEEIVASSIEGSLQRTEHRAARGSLQQFILFTIMRSSMRVSVPKGSPTLLPTMPPSLESAAARWSGAHDDLAASMRKVGSKRESEALFRHPIGGWMSLPLTASFLVLHLEHHAHQWTRIRNAVA